MILYAVDCGQKEQTAKCKTEEAVVVVGELCEAKY
jgi:hypothetical protein